MKSQVISDPKRQMTLDFEPGLAERFPSLRECVATGVYRRGLGAVAIDLNKAPGNLSVRQDAARDEALAALAGLAPLLKKAGLV